MTIMPNGINSAVAFADQETELHGYVSRGIVAKQETQAKGTKGAYAKPKRVWEVRMHHYTVL